MLGLQLKVEEFSVNSHCLHVIFSIKTSSCWRDCALSNTLLHIANIDVWIILKELQR